MDVEWSVLYHGHFIPGTRWTGDWVSPTIVLRDFEKRKLSCRCRRQTPGLAARSLVTILTTAVLQHVA
jgi:hypothetical protein